MIEPPKIVETPVVLIACIPLTVPRAKIREVMGPGLRELMTTLASQGVTAAGPWLTHHRRMAPDVFDFEIAVPVTRAIAPAGRVVPGELRAARVARTVYHGPYEGLETAWSEFETWIKTQGHAEAVDLWEQYLVGPETGPDGSAYRTQLNRPLVG
jgi:effector-binding domain-containing protein